MVKWSTEIIAFIIDLNYNTFSCNCKKHAIKCLKTLCSLKCIILKYIMPLLKICYKVLFCKWGYCKSVFNSKDKWNFLFLQAQWRQLTLVRWTMARRLSCSWQQMRQRGSTSHRLQRSLVRQFTPLKLKSFYSVFCSFAMVDSSRRNVLFFNPQINFAHVSVSCIYLF